MKKTKLRHSKKSKKIIEDIDSCISDHWFYIGKLMEEVEKKSKHMKMLFEKKLPIFFSTDAPAECWLAILQHSRAISALEAIKSKCQ